MISKSFLTILLFGLLCQEVLGNAKAKARRTPCNNSAGQCRKENQCQPPKGTIVTSQDCTKKLMCCILNCKTTNKCKKNKVKGECIDINATCSGDIIKNGCKKKDSCQCCVIPATGVQECKATSKCEKNKVKGQCIGINATCSGDIIPKGCKKKKSCQCCVIPVITIITAGGNLVLSSSSLRSLGTSYIAFQDTPMTTFSDGLMEISSATLDISGGIPASTPPANSTVTLEINSGNLIIGTGNLVTASKTYAITSGSINSNGGTLGLQMPNTTSTSTGAVPFNGDYSIDYGFIFISNGTFTTSGSGLLNVFTGTLFFNDGNIVIV